MSDYKPNIITVECRKCSMSFPVTMKHIPELYITGTCECGGKYVYDARTPKYHWRWLAVAVVVIGLFMPTVELTARNLIVLAIIGAVVCAWLQSRNYFFKGWPDRLVAGLVGAIVTPASLAIWVLIVNGVKWLFAH